MEEFITNKELLKDLGDVYRKLRSGEMSIKEAQSIATVAGRIIKAGCAQLDYNKWVKKTETIEYFES